MYRSARARKAQRRKIQKWLLAGVGVVAILIAAVAVAQSGSNHKSSGCLILDVSESTAEARTLYPAEFRTFASSIAVDGSGQICLILAAAEPIAESAPIYTSVGPDPSNAGKPKGVEEVKANIETATAEVERLGHEPGVREGGSGLIEAATVAAEHLEPGDKLLYLSDGLQWTRGGGYLAKMDLSPSGIASLIQILRERELLPDLDGIHVYFPLILYHPEGFHGNGVEVRKVKSFWEAWAKATGAELTMGRLE